MTDNYLVENKKLPMGAAYMPKENRNGKGK